MADGAGAVEPRRNGTAARRVLAGLAVAAVLLVLVFAGRQAAGAIPRFAAWVDSQGIVGPAAFVLGYILATVVFVPASLLTLAAGAMFGLAWGTLWVFIGATAGATVAFLVARYVARGALERRLAGSARFAAIDRAIGRNGLRIVTLLRLSPAVPFIVANYALGLTRVRLRDYLLASPGMLPATLLYVYYGKVAGDVAAVAAGVEADRGAAYWAVLGLGLAATIAATTVVTRLARRALQEATE